MSRTSPLATGKLPVAVRDTLLHLARRTLTEYLGAGRLPPVPTDSPAFLEPRATFVTLRTRASGELRGCRGETQARLPLAESVRAMAIASAVDDPRFPPVTADEVPGLHIEINVLTPLVPIDVKGVEVGRHGLMISRGPRAGLFLPEVPVAYGWDLETYLRMLCRKASLPDDAWHDSGAQLFAFESESWGEPE